MIDQRPMLAREYEKHKHKIEFPVYVQPKLDGVRLFWDGPSRKFASRTGKTLFVPRLVQETLKVKFSKLVLDGELFLKGACFEAISGAARRKVSGSDLELEYHVFDVVSDRPQHERLDLLSESQGWNSRVKCVPSRVAASQDTLMVLFAEYVADGYEGVIIRNFFAPYRHCRTIDLLKLKPWHFERFKVIGMEPARGKYEGMLGSLVLEGGGKVGTGFSAAERAQYWEEKPIGRYVEVKFQERSRKGIPRFPVFNGFKAKGAK